VFHKKLNLVCAWHCVSTILVGTHMWENVPSPFGYVEVDVLFIKEID
jgi:hypothetical protein